MLKEYEDAIQRNRRYSNVMHEKEQVQWNRQQAKIVMIRDCLRIATPQDYADWLQGFKGAVTSYYDMDLESDLTNKFRVATQSFKLPGGLKDTHALHIIVPADINVELPDDYGYCTIYKMPDDLFGYWFVPLYRDVAMLCDD